MISMLLIQSYWDLRYREIPLIATLLGGVVGFVLSIVQQREVMDLVWAMIPGIVCLLLGKVTRQAIGYGDGFLLCAMGMFVSCQEVLSIVMGACMLAGAVALALFAFQKKRGKDQIPFVPFLLVASLLHYLEKGIIV